MEKQSSELELSEVDMGGERQDEVFAVLSDSRRRFLLRCLQTAQGPVSVNKLATNLVTWEGQQQVSDSADDDTSAIQVLLVHNHLPKMEEAGLVEYDDTQQMVTPTDRIHQAQPHLQIMASD